MSYKVNGRDSDSFPWYFNDHCGGHIERVAVYRLSLCTFVLLVC